MTKYAGQLVEGDYCWDGFAKANGFLLEQSARAWTGNTPRSYRKKAFSANQGKGKIKTVTSHLNEPTLLIFGSWALGLIFLVLFFFCRSSYATWKRLILFFLAEFLLCAATLRSQEVSALIFDALGTPARSTRLPLLKDYIYLSASILLPVALVLLILRLLGIIRLPFLLLLFLLGALLSMGWHMALIIISYL